MIVKGAIRKGSEGYDYVKRLLASMESQSVVRDKIRADGGGISFHCLSRLSKDEASICDGCEGDFFPSNKTQKCCSMQCRDMVRRFTKRGLPKPKYVVNEPSKYNDIEGFNEI